MFPNERGAWTDKNGKKQIAKDEHKLPGKTWVWKTIWFVEKHPDQTDDDGWTYATDFRSKFKKNKGMGDLVRRRKWVRVCVNTASMSTKKERFQVKMEWF